jgi:hypothetical protein
MKRWALSLLILCSCIGGEWQADPEPVFDPNVAAPEITSQVKIQIVEPFEAAEFAVTAEGPGPLAYRWYRFSYDPADPFVMELVDGAFDSSYTISSATVEDELAGFVCVVTGPGGEAWSKPAVLRVIPDDDAHDD